MEYKYTINDIARETKVSTQSLYSLIKKNKEFINKNSTRKQRKVYYNQEALNFFISYYQPEKVQKTAQEIPEEAIKDEKNEDSDNSAEQIEALKAEIEDLKRQLSEKDAERKELLQQNGALILTIQQQQQEKMLLLPAPKKSLWERIFSKKSQN